MERILLRPSVSTITKSVYLQPLLNREIDYISDGNTTIRVGNGVPMLQKVTAAGCSLSSIACAFIVAGRKEGRRLRLRAYYLLHNIWPYTFIAIGVADVRSVAYACAVLGVCAELAAQVSRGPGSFRVALIDQLHLISEEDIYKMAKVGP